MGKDLRTDPRVRLVAGIVIVGLAALILVLFLPLLAPDRPADIRIAEVRVTHEECQTVSQGINFEIFLVNLGDATGFAKIQIFVNGEWVLDLVYFVPPGHSEEFRFLNYQGECNPAVSYILADTWQF